MYEEFFAGFVNLCYCFVYDGFFIFFVVGWLDDLTLWPINTTIATTKEKFRDSRKQTKLYTCNYISVGYK